MNSLGELKITFVAGTLGQGGAERQLFLVCRLLKEAGAEIQVLSLTEGEFWESRIRALGIEVIWVGRRAGKFSRVLAIRKQLKRWNPTICQSQHFFTNIYVALACKGLGILDLGAVRSNIHQEMNSRNQMLCRWGLRWPSCILANSRQAIRTGGEYGVETDHFRYLPNIVEPVSESNRYDRDEPFVILGVGRLVALKHWHIFIQVIADLRLQGHRVRGQLIGDGPHRDFLENFAQKLGLDETALEFVGLVPEVKPYYADATLLLATSSLEGMPNAVMEAMAAGLPVVTTRVGGVVALIQHERNGYLTEVDATASLREHCSKLLRDSGKRRQLGQAARATIVENHSPEAVTRHLQTLYKDLLD